MKNHLPLSWHTVPGYEDCYQINALGTIRRISESAAIPKATPTKRKYLKGRLNQGYIEYRLCKNGVQKVYGQHRLLALTFIPKPHNKNEVNHINGIKHDNRLENLEWVTRSENIQHAHKHGLFKTLDKYNKKVTDNCTGEVFESAKKAARSRGYRYSTLKNYLNGNRPNPTCLEYHPG